jgi:hypothetical protein
LIDFPFDELPSSGGFIEGRPHPLSRGELILFTLQRDFGYLYDFEFNVAVGCDRGFDYETGRDLGTAWITPDISHSEAKLAIEIDGIQHRLQGRSLEDEERDALLASEGWEVLRIPSYEIYNMDELPNVLNRIEYEVMSSLVKADFQAGVPPHRRRYYPIGVTCTHCGFHRPGHKIGQGAMCIECLAKFSDGPYVTPIFECFFCKRKMEGPGDLETWSRLESIPAEFECNDHLYDQWEEE